MKTISSLIDDLNRLCNETLVSDEEFKDAKNIREMFQRIKQEGYRFIVYQIESQMPEPALMPDNVVPDQGRQAEAQGKKEKMIAPFFVLADPLFRKIILHDPEGKLS